MVEQDDPAGAASIQDVLKRSPVSVNGISIWWSVCHFASARTAAWLEEKIKMLTLRLVILDSYTALRSSRGYGVDIVKAEHHDLTMLDELAKRTGSAIDVVPSRDQRCWIGASKRLAPLP
jgi:hypothetical protein